MKLSERIVKANDILYCHTDCDKPNEVLIIEEIKALEKDAYYWRLLKDLPRHVELTRSVCEKAEFVTWGVIDHMNILYHGGDTPEEALDNYYKNKEKE